MKEPIPIHQYLPNGPLKDMGEKYVNGLPDVGQEPLTPESLMTPSDYTWSDYAVSYLLLYPAAVIALALVGALGLWLYFRICQRHENELTQVCRHCGASMSPCALFCPKCHTLNPEPHCVNWVGYAKRSIVPEEKRDAQRQVLRRFRRCHHCAHPLEHGRLNQICPECGRPVLMSVASVKEFDYHVRHYRAWVYVTVAIIGIIPIIGPLLASFLYRRTIVSPYGLYMHVYKDSFVMVVLFLLRQLFRLVPFIGIIGMPILCIAEFNMYRRMFLWKAYRILKDKGA